jgi:hypothetical protein
MIIFRESVRLEEILQSAGAFQLQILKNQMASNSELNHTLTTPMGDLPKYQFLTDNDWIKSYSLLSAIEYTIQNHAAESYFIKTSKGIYVGFIALLFKMEDGKTIVNDIKMFSFGLSPKEDENMIRKDVPHLLDQCLKRFPKIRWEVMKNNKANVAYEIYRKKHNGTREDLGNAWEYICYSE